MAAPSRCRLVPGHRRPAGDFAHPDRDAGAWPARWRCCCTHSIYGRYLYAIGSNEQAARYAGIPTDRYEILAYVICAGLAGLGGVLFLLDGRTAQPTTAGSYLELYAITGAVLGGCSLRGGEGTIAGMILGAAVLPLALSDLQLPPSHRQRPGLHRHRHGPAAGHDRQ